MNIFRNTTVFVAACLCGLIAFAGEPTGDVSVRSKREECRQAFETKAKEIISKLTLEEKCGLMDMNAKAVPAHNINSHYWWSEALHGVARNGKATQFPQSICMASTWNPDLIQQMADAISDEARAKHHSKPGRYGRYQGLTLWSPTINLARDPRWGRNEETYGEDPYLTARTAVSFVTGLQGDHPKYLKAVATVKHFIANNTEYNRTKVTVPISEPMLRNYYLVPYRDSVVEADVQSIMTAYNGINGAPCGANKRLLTDILKNEWGFTGAVVTDVGVPSFMTRHHHYTKNDVESAAVMINAGVDLMSSDDFGRNLAAAVKKGLVSEATLDAALTRNLTKRLQIGQISDDSDNPFRKIPLSVVGCAQHLEIAEEIARQGIVLLKNEPVDSMKGQPLLPLTEKKYSRVILAGPYAKTAQLGHYSGTPTKSGVTPYDGLVKALKGTGMSLQGLNSPDLFKIVPESALSPAPGVDGDQGLKGEYFAGTKCTGKPAAVRLDKSVDFSWPKPIENIDPDIPQPTFAVRWTGSINADVSGEYQFAVKCDDGMRLWIDGDLIIDDWNRHPITTSISKIVKFEAGKSYNIRVEYFDAGGEAEAHLLWKKPLSDVDKERESDDAVVVFVGGHDVGMANEFSDLMNLQLPDSQWMELNSLQKKYKNIVIVLNGGGIVADAELFAKYPAVMQAWYPGQEGGTALAELLLGKVSPSGRLPLTWYRDVKDLPDFDDYDLSSGRTYMFCDKPVQFPFGHGLSYSSFNYSKAKLLKNYKGEELSVSVKLKNIGEFDSDEVVQVYAVDKGVEGFMPKKRLVAFKRVHLKKGDSTKVIIPVKLDSVGYWSEEKKAYQPLSGAVLEVGASSGDIRASVAIK